MNMFSENYEIDRHGIIKQKLKQDFKYDQDYLDTRYTPISQKCVSMSHLRLDYLLSTLKGRLEINSLLDFGCGNGDFLNAASTIIPNTYSYDVIPQTFSHSKSVNYDEVFSKRYDVVTFFDSLEHVEDPYSLIQKLDTQFVFISVPWCHYKERGETWFLEWKHRRYNEHLYHFDLSSITSFFDNFGYELLTSSNIEDTIRKSHEPNNILSCIFVKK